MIFLLATLGELGASHKDVVIAELGATAAIVGLVLVFLGVLVTSYQGLLGQLSEQKLSPVRKAAWLAWRSFGLGFISLTLNIVWLVADAGRCFYIATLVLFFTLLAGLITVAAYSARVLLR